MPFGWRGGGIPCLVARKYNVWIVMDTVSMQDGENVMRLSEFF